MGVTRTEDRADVPGGSVWLARLGTGDATPALVLHGGPGSAHDYVLPLAERLAGERPVVVYDQLGCGRSDRPEDAALWTLDRFVAEVDAVRVAAGLGRCHLVGHSWGGWLAVEYMARRPAGIVGLVLASTSASMPEFVAEVGRLVDDLPEPHRGALIDLGREERYDDPAYLAALDVFYHRHLCRLDPWPDVLVDGLDEEGENQAYRIMAGPNDVVVDGTLRDWDRTADLAAIAVPTLVTCGRYDEIPLPCSETLVAGLPDARLVVFEASGHCPHLEEPDLYATTVATFLAQVDARAARGGQV
jgi:proline iminopeptidase